MPTGPGALGGFGGAALPRSWFEDLSVFEGLHGDFRLLLECTAGDNRTPT